MLFYPAAREAHATFHPNPFGQVSNVFQEIKSRTVNHICRAKKAASKRLTGFVYHLLCDPRVLYIKGSGGGSLKRKQWGRVLEWEINFTAIFSKAVTN